MNLLEACDFKTFLFLKMLRDDLRFGGARPTNFAGWIVGAISLCIDFVTLISLHSCLRLIVLPYGRCRWSMFGAHPRIVDAESGWSYAPLHRDNYDGVVDLGLYVTSKVSLT